MKRQILVCALLVAAAAAVGAQQAGQSSQPNPYEGTSNPPPDDQITTSGTPEAKPPAGHYAQPAVPAPSPSQSASQPAAADQPVNPPAYQGDDSGIVQVAPGAPAEPAVAEHAYASDPDGDIVHPRALRPGELGEGTNISVRLMQRLSTVSSQKGEAFRTVVASDVVEGGQVVIPAGAEIDGRVIQVSSGHVGGHGFMRLQPEAVILPNGSRFMLHAETTGTPGSRTRMGSEGAITPDSRLKRDGIEYGGAVGAGAVTGAILGGPAGAVTGGLIGAGAVTVHLLVNHPQATLESGTTMVFTLTEPLDMVPAPVSGN
ncbi:MAG: hypothetical protein ABR912_02530 [Terracidiphilus sp.]|jgi:hypothetical protein